MANIFKFVFSRLSLKDSIYIGLILTGLFFGYRLYKDMSATVEAQKIAYEKLAENIARSSSEFVTKRDLENFGDSISDNFDFMKKDIKKLGGQVVAVGQTVAVLKENITKDAPSDTTAEIPSENGTSTTKEDFKKIKTKDGLSLAWATYKNGYTNPWTVGTYPLEFQINTILGTNKDDQLIPVHELLVFNNKDPDNVGKPYKLDVTSSTFKQTRPTEKTFFLWAPHVDFGFNAGATLNGSGVYGVDVGFSTMAYGRTKNDNTWRFVRGSFGLRDRFSDPQFTLSPVGYNIGEPLPILSDVWLYPTVGFGFKDAYGLGFSLSTTF